MPTGREWLNYLPYGSAINGFRDGGMRGGFMGLWNSSMPGRAVNFFRGLGDGVQGNGLAGLMGHGYSPSGIAANGYNAGPPTAAEQYGNPASPDFVGPPEAQDGNGGGWMDWIAQHLGGSGSGGGFQGGGLGNARASDRVVTGGMGNMGGSSLNPLLSGNTSGGLGRLMMSNIPWRQSGIDFLPRQMEF